MHHLLLGLGSSCLLISQVLTFSEATSCVLQCLSQHVLAFCAHIRRSSRFMILAADSRSVVSLPTDMSILTGVLIKKTCRQPLCHRLVEGSSQEADDKRLTNPFHRFFPVPTKIQTHHQYRIQIPRDTGRDLGRADIQGGQAQNFDPHSREVPPETSVILR